MATVIFVNIWRSFPYYTISFLSALQSVPGELSEAAAIDGAGIFKRFLCDIAPAAFCITGYCVYSYHLDGGEF